MNKTLPFHIALSAVLHTTLLASEISPLLNWRTYTHDMIHTAPLRSQPFRIAATERIKGINYINTLRTGAGMIPYSANRLLHTAAQKHMDYLLEQHRFSHYENNVSSPFYSGYDAGDRITAAGYSWQSYSENLSSGDRDIYESVDGLFSAIYHRLGFLEFRNDEIGIGSVQSPLYGTMYGYDTAGTAWWEVLPLNPAYVLWPYQNYRHAQTSFNNYEAPDPLRECPAGGITGNPISIAFNPNKNSTVTMTTFKIFNSDGSEITNTKTLTASTDPSGFLTEHQFVLFPMNALSLDSNYHVVFQYDEGGTPKTVSWDFHTRRYTEKRYEVFNGGTYDLINGQSYIMHLKPDSCMTVLGAYSWNNGNTAIERLSVDTFRITIAGDTDISFSNFTFSLRAAARDQAIAPSSSVNTMAALSVINFLLSSN